MLFTYLFRELRRRHRQALMIAIGLAVGIGLVVTVSAASSGVKDAQQKVLHSLYGVGTDITVTKTAAAPTPGQNFGGFGSRPTGSFNRSSIRPRFGQATFSDKAVTQAAALPGVNATAGSLSLQVTNVSGSFGSGSTSGGFGGFGGSGSSGTGGGGGPSFSFNQTTLTGVTPTSTGLGPLSASEITSGKYFSSAAAVKDAIVSSSYASQNSLKVGSTVTLDGNALDVIGVAQVPSSSAGASDVYVTLAEAQSLASLSGDVTTVYVSATSASNVSTVAKELQHALPGTTVTTSADLAKEVTGSITSAASLADTLGKWLAGFVLLAAFLVAILLMLAAVSRRVREFGTLKAIGWRTRRVVGQVMSEGLALGLVGGALGIVLGILGAELVSAFSPSLSATVGPSFATGGTTPTFPGGRFGGFGGSGRPGGGSFASRAADLTHTVVVHLTAPLQGGAIVLAVVLALAGGLLAGGVGAWRAARLRPAEALRQVA